MTTGAIKALWKNTSQIHKILNDLILREMSADVHAFRDFIEPNSYGYGERVLYGMWETLIREAPDEFTFLEIGVHRGATLALAGFLADKYGKKARIIGISPMNGHPDYIKRDFNADVAMLWDYFNIKTPYLIYQGFSSDPELILTAMQESIRGCVDMLYIDGSHDYKDVLQDLIIYPSLALREGGRLVVDDCACDLDLPKDWFAGHQSVTNALTYYRSKTDNSLVFEFSVSHNQVFRKV